MSNSLDLKYDALGFLCAFLEEKLFDYRDYVDSHGKSYAVVDGDALFELMLTRGFIQAVESAEGVQMANALKSLVQHGSLSEEDAPLIAQALGEKFAKNGVVFRMSVDRNPHAPERYLVKFELSW